MMAIERRPISVLREFLDNAASGGIVLARFRPIEAEKRASSMSASG